MGNSQRHRQDIAYLALLALTTLPALLVTPSSDWAITIIVNTALIAIFSISRITRPLFLIPVLLAACQIGFYFYTQRIIDRYFWMTIISAYQWGADYANVLPVWKLVVFGIYIITLLSTSAYLIFSKNSYSSRILSAAACIILIAAICVRYHDAEKNSWFAKDFHHTYFAQVAGGLTDLLPGKEIKSTMALRFASDESENVPQILVIIGESETRTRMGIYGYERNTTPYAGSPYVFANEYAVGLNTQPNVQALLTGSVKQSLLSSRTNIFDLAKSAKYKIIFIDNNGFHFNDPVVKFAFNNASKYISMNHAAEALAENDNKVKYDGVLIRPFKDQVKKHENDKAIYVLHMMGSHPSQNRRYPPEFNKFPSYYDNSVLYTNWFLSEIRKAFFSKQHRPAVIIYVADHGVALPPGCGFSDSIPNPENANYGANDNYLSSYEVPLLVWTNREFEAEHEKLSLHLNNNHSIPLDHRFLFYSVANLIGITAIDDVDVGRYSIFSGAPNFLPRIDVYGKNIDEGIHAGRICAGDKHLKPLPRDRAYAR